MHDVKPLVGTVVVVILLLFGAAYYFSSTGVDDNPTVLSPSDNSGDIAPQSIAAQHRYVGTTHTIVGEVDVPTPCYELAHEIIVRESYPEQVTIALTTAAEDTDACVQVITRMQFKVEFDAAENALITATLNGEPAVLNLLKVEANEEFEDFGEVFKG